VNPRTLTVSDVMHANCGNPTLYHEHVMPLAYDVRLPKGKVTGEAKASGGQEAFVRIATADPHARDGYTLGPVLMRYVPIAGVSAEWVYGDGALWLYGPQGDGQYKTDLLQISTTTGRVLGRWSVPALEYPIAAADSDGLWLAPSVLSGLPRSASRKEAELAGSVYLVTPGKRSPARVMTLGRYTARWMVATGHSVWIEYYLNGHSVQWLRLGGASGKIQARVRRTSAGPQGQNSSEEPYEFAAGAQGGIYDLEPGTTGQPEHVVWQDPRLDAPRTIATVQPAAGTPTWATSTAFHHDAFYFLNPPAIAAGSPGYSRTTSGIAGDIYRLRQPTKH
jgi:hypothetical protein